MKVGEAITYRCGEELRIVRKERDSYMSYVATTDSFCSFDEDLFDILMSTLERNIENLIENLADRCDGGREGAVDLIRSAQKYLVDICMLEESTCRDSWQGVEKAC